MQQDKNQEDNGRQTNNAQTRDVDHNIGPRYNTTIFTPTELHDFQIADDTQYSSAFLVLAFQSSA